MKEEHDNKDKDIHLTQEAYINLMAHKITHDVVSETRIDIDRLRSEINGKFADVNGKFTDVKNDANNLRKDIDTRFTDMRNDIDVRFSSIDKRFELVDKRFDNIHKFLYWLVGLNVTAILLPIVFPLIKSSLAH